MDDSGTLLRSRRAAAGQAVREEVQRHPYQLGTMAATGDPDDDGDPVVACERWMQDEAEFR